MAKKSAVIAKSSATNPKSKTPPSNSHPSYFEMITDAISTLKDRTGSSQQAMSKLIENKYKDALPDNFKKLLSVQLKRLVESGRLAKVKNSYKIPSTRNIKEMKPNKSIAKTKDKKEMSSERKAKKTKRLSQVKTPEVLKRKDEKKAVMASVSGRKTKRLSQVKPPEIMMKKITKKKKAGN